eukprot:4869800-Pleurochrysis_carterae.AAC.1
MATKSRCAARKDARAPFQLCSEITPPLRLTEANFIGGPSPGYPNVLSQIRKMRGRAKSRLL